MGNFNDMQPCAHCGQVRNTQSMDCTNGLWFCAQCARDHSHLARMAEAHEPELIRAEIEAKVAEWAKPKRRFRHSKIAAAIFGGVIGIVYSILLLLIKYWVK